MYMELYLPKQPVHSNSTWTNATPFTRIWCGFEQATVVQVKKLLLDFATVHEGKAHVLTEGVAKTDTVGASDWGRKVGKFDIFLSYFFDLLLSSR